VKETAARVVSGLRWGWDHSVGALLGLLLVGAIRGYQTLLSPLLGARCRFHPSCSNYALGAVRVHGPLKGTALAAWRLLRCNPWNDGGLDPVPPRGAWVPTVHPDGRPRQATTPAAGGAPVTTSHSHHRSGDRA